MTHDLTNLTATVSLSKSQFDKALKAVKRADGVYDGLAKTWTLRRAEFDTINPELVTVVTIDYAPSEIATEIADLKALRQTNWIANHICALEWRLEKMLAGTYTHRGELAPLILPVDRTLPAWANWENKNDNPENWVVIG
jgi:hypothetical protein